jgi:gluconolactonase
MITRRTFILGVAGAGIAGTVHAAPSARHDASFETIAGGLLAPEGPKPLKDGSVLVCEMARGTLSQVMPGGKVNVLADLGGSPNGVAIGPDGAAYVMNNGGMKFTRKGDLLQPDPPAAKRDGGSIHRVDIKTGKASTIFSGKLGHPVKAPNDLVFDRSGGFWFTDPAVPHSNDSEQGAVFWGKPDGSEIHQVLESPGPNGIALSPDHKTLYIALTSMQSIVACNITAPGKLAMNSKGVPDTRVIATLKTEQSYFDSMAVEADGTIVVGTLFKGCLSLFRPGGELLDQLYFPEIFVTNLAFGGNDMQTAYVTLTTSGRLVAVRWPRKGLRLANQ